MRATVLIQDVYKIAGMGVIPVGIVRSGTLKPGMKLNIGGRIMSVKTIEMYHAQVKEANPGDNVGLSLSDGDYGALKSVVRQEVVFSDDASAVTVGIARPNPVHPKGLLDSILSLFRRR